MFSNPKNFKMKKLSFLVLLFGLISFSLVSCGDDDDGGGGSIYSGPNYFNAWGDAYFQALMEINNAAQAYAMEPTEENCNAFKAAYQSFINNVKPFQNCTAITGQDRQEFLQQIEEAEEEIDDLC